MTWQGVYDYARSTGDFAPVDAWYDTNVGRTSTEDLLDLGAGQFTVTSTELASRASSHPDHFFQEEYEFGMRWVITDVMTSNLRITSAGGLPLVVRQSTFPRRDASYLYAIHSPTTSPIHNLTVDHCDFDGENEPSGAFAVYMPSNDYVDDDTLVTYCKFLRFQSCVRGVFGTTMEYCLVSDLYYDAESHNTAASFRGGHSHARRNRVRPGSSGSSGINFYAEVSPGDDPEGYDFLSLIENMIHASESAVAVNFPDEDDPSILFSNPFTGMTRLASGNIIDTRFSNPTNWVPPGGSTGELISGSGIVGNLHWNLTSADDGSLP